MIDALAALDACAAIEAGGVKPDVNIEFGPFLTVERGADGVWRINNRGSKPWPDWVRDFFSVPVEPLEHPRLGWIPAGIYIGMEPAREALKAIIGNEPREWRGHSLGGAEAILGAMLDHLDGLPVTGCIALEPPKCAGGTLQKLAAGVRWPLEVYHTHADIVPDVSHAYGHPVARTWLGQPGQMPPLFKVPFDPFYWHHLANIRPFMISYLAAQASPAP